MSEIRERLHAHRNDAASARRWSTTSTPGPCLPTRPYVRGSDDSTGRSPRWVRASSGNAENARVQGGEP